MLAENNIRLSASNESLRQISIWFNSIVRKHTSNDDPDSFTFSICNDLAMFLGQETISRYPFIEWKLNTVSIKDVSYHRPVLMGFKVKNKKFNIDFDLLICQYAYQVIDGECDDHFFEELIDSIKGYCE